MSRLQNITESVNTRFSGKDYYCEMPSAKPKLTSEWPCDIVPGDLIDCHMCPFNHEAGYKALLEALCPESPQ